MPPQGEPALQRLSTPAGDVAVEVDPGRVWRVGYAPDAWAWTPWEYATDGRFHGRWDDPAGTFRTVYAGTTLLACLLEVLARFRPDPLLAAQLGQIEEENGDRREFPTAPTGRLPGSWLASRVAATAVLSGRFAAVTRTPSLATLRGQFLSLALSLGLPDLDAGSLRLAEPRALTQAVAGWLADLTQDGEPAVHGVGFRSRHGDEHGLWAVFEREGDVSVSSRLSELTSAPLQPDAALWEACRVHRLTWEPGA